MSNLPPSFLNVLAVILLGSFFATSATVMESWKNREANFNELPPAFQQQVQRR